MRTSSSSSSNESFFCQAREPPIPYTIRPCGQCELCCTSYYNRDRPRSPIRFRSFDKFIFLNGYETILNAHAVRILFGKPFDFLSLCLLVMSNDECCLCPSMSMQ